MGSFNPDVDEVIRTARDNLERVEHELREANGQDLENMDEETDLILQQTLAIFHSLHQLRRAYDEDSENEELDQDLDSEYEEDSGYSSMSEPDMRLIDLPWEHESAWWSHSGSSDNSEDSDED